MTGWVAKITPAVAVADGCVTITSLAGDAGSTMMPASVPVRLWTCVSVAVIDCEPAVLRVAVKVPVPFVSVAEAGSFRRGRCW